MKFIRDLTEVILKGNPKLSQLPASLKSIVCKWQSEDQGYLIELKKVSVSAMSSKSTVLTSESKKDLPVNIQSLLSEFEDILTCQILCQ